MRLGERERLDFRSPPPDASLSIKPSRKCTVRRAWRAISRFVRDENDGVAALIEIFEQGHDFFAGFGIEVPGRFVRQDDRRIVDQRARDRDALALAA